jgi:hypothetical protein
MRWLGGIWCCEGLDKILGEVGDGGQTYMSANLRQKLLSSDSGIILWTAKMLFQVELVSIRPVHEMRFNAYLLQGLDKGIFCSLCFLPDSIRAAGC